MPYNLSDYIVIGISSSALFDLSYEDGIYRHVGLNQYIKYQIEHENDILKPGPGFMLVKAFLRLNEIIPNERKIEVIILSRNSPDTSLRIFNSIDAHKLDIPRAVLTSGHEIEPYIKALNVDLFLSTNSEDVKHAINHDVASGLILNHQKNYEKSIDEIRIAFDGDAVLFTDESERIYQKEGLEAFAKHEKDNALIPLEKGPFAKFLKTLSLLQQEFQDMNLPIRTALVTSRGHPAHERVIRTLREWNVKVDEVFFLGGVEKTEVLKAFDAHIFFDDQDMHLDKASLHTPCAKVPYKS